MKGGYNGFYFLLTFNVHYTVRTILLNSFKPAKLSDLHVSKLLLVS